MTRVKICGLTSPEHAALAAKAGADFIGLVFWEHSARHVSVHEAKAIVSALPAELPVATSPAEPRAEERRPLPWLERSAAYLSRRLQRKRPQVVGVFADMPASMINAIADRVGLDLVQLSGHEPWEEALAIRRPVIKAVHVGAGATARAILEQIEVGTATLCLLDTSSAVTPGGTGQVFDWSIAATVARELPLMLAGGLTPENVATAVMRVRPWAVDVSSGVETGGLKDPDKIRTFLRAVREADEERST
jgi:phosphoribosylanthranilate isomerase